MAPSMNRLYRAVKKYTKQPTRFICFTEDALGIDEGVIIYDLPEVNLQIIPIVRPFVSVAGRHAGGFRRRCSLPRSGYCCLRRS